MSAAENRAVFLSYASQDAEAARRICEALRSAGVEVWFDADGGLEHGDEWDAKIRRQVKECVLFIPIISANTQARHEGYFRIEWELAAQRAMGIASGIPFILPVVIDDTREPAALVPDRFRMVQWTKLPGGVVTPEVKARYLKLWSHRTGVLRHEEMKSRGNAESLADEDSENPISANRASGRRRRRILVVSALATAVVVAAAAIWQPWNRNRPGGIETSAAKSGARVSRPEVATLLARVRALSAKTDVVRTELDTAVGLLEQAVKLDATDANVWAEWALVDGRYIEEWFDRSAARRNQARRHATQAMGLDSGNAMARFADASTMVLLNNDAPTRQAAITILEPLADQFKDHGGALLLLGTLKWDIARPEAVSHYFDRAARIPGWAARAEIQRAHQFVFSSFQYQRGEDAVDRGLAAERAAYLINYKLFFLFAWHGDVAAAQRLMMEIPAAMLGEDFYGSGRFCIELRARDYDRAVAALRAIPRDYMESFAYSGPTGYYIGYALARAGKVAAAEIEWRGALEAVNRRLSASPNDQDLLLFKALLLAALGDKAAGEKLWRSTRELFGEQSLRTWPGYFAFLEFLSDDAAIAQLDDMVGKGQPFGMAALLRLDPYLDRLRSHPKFVELLARAEADPRLSPKAQAAAKAGNPTGAVGLADKSVAVLAFANVGGDTANEAFVDGISEELINVLGRVPGLTVRGRSSSFYFKGKEASAQEKGRQLGATYLVDGSVRRAGDMLRITARLMRAATDEVVWASEPLNRDAKNVFAVQEEIAGLIANALSLKLGVSAAGASTAVNPEVFELYVQARQAWNRRTQEGFERAEQLLNRALEREPNFARGHAALADVWTEREVSGKMGEFAQRDSHAVARIEAQVRRAVQLEPELAEARAALGNILWRTWRLGDAIRELRAAIALNPNYASAHHWLGRALLSDARFDESIAELARAAELDPLSPRILDNYASALHDRSRYAEALALNERALVLQPDSNQAAIHKVRDLSGLGRHEEAVALMRRLPYHRTLYENYAVEVFARAGLKAEAEAVLARMTSEGDRFLALAALGRVEDALAAMNVATINVHNFYMVFLNPAFDPVRQDPRFTRALATLGMTEAHARAQAWRAAQSAKHGGQRAEDGGRKK